MYGDTAMFGAAHALRCCIDFYGTDHILFGSDSPFDPESGPGYIRATIRNLEEIGLSPRRARGDLPRQRHPPDRAHRQGVITRSPNCTAYQAACRDIRSVAGVPRATP